MERFRDLSAYLQEKYCGGILTEEEMLAGIRTKKAKKLQQTFVHDPDGTKKPIAPPSKRGMK